MLLTLLVATSALGREGADWRNLGNLKPGQRIGVIQASGKRIEGALASVSDFAISVRTDQLMVLPKDSVTRVYRRPRISRGWRALIGAGIGLAGGVALNSTIGQYLRNESHDTSPAVWIVAGAVAGAALGGASGGGDHTVYRRAGHP